MKVEKALVSIEPCPTCGLQKLCGTCGEPCTESAVVQCPDCDGEHYYYLSQRWKVVAELSEALIEKAIAPRRWWQALTRRVMPSSAAKPIAKALKEARELERSRDD